MKSLKWSNKLSVGHPVIDAQHKKLIEMITALDSEDANKSDAITRMIDYVSEHFTTEERLMAEAGYPDLEAHRRVHVTFVRQAVQYAHQERLYSLTIKEMRDYLQDWLFDHIMGVDQDYVPFLQKLDERGTAHPTS